MKKLLSWLWQAPQNILGWLAYTMIKGHEICTKEICEGFIKCKLSIGFPGGVTLGNYIILGNISHLQHELGHTKQSQILGPLYLLIIGIPSLLHAAIHSIVCKNKDYYHFYTEKWANKLVGICNTKNIGKNCRKNIQLQPEL